MSAIGVTLPFWGLALAMVAAATAAVCLPLLRGRGRRSGDDDERSRLAVYRDRLRELEAERASGLLSEEQLAVASEELTARLAADRAGSQADRPAAARAAPGLAAALAVGLPAASLAGYLLVGSPEVMVEQTQAKEAAAHAEQDIEELIRTQTAHLAEKPDDALAWVALGATYSGLDRWAEAEQAFAKAYSLEPKEAFIVSAYAEALAINAGRDLTGRPIELVREALLISPQDEKALELAGIHAFQEKEYGKAAYYFRQLLKALPPDSPYADGIRAAMREAKAISEEAAFGPPLDTRPPPDGVHAVEAPPVITGVVELDPGLAEGLTGSEAVFLYARPVSGGGAPVAGLRSTVDQLPIPFTLDDSLAPLPDQALSTHDNVRLIARISRTGEAEPMPGDLEGEILSVRVGSQGVKLVIDRKRE
jgi:cytochrome c-type biogenesis protein CcmH